MPIKQCEVNGKSGYKWGNEGKCYTGPNAREKAKEQGIAIGEWAAEVITNFRNRMLKALKK